MLRNRLFLASRRFFSNSGHTRQSLHPLPPPPTEVSATEIGVVACSSIGAIGSGAYIARIPNENVPIEDRIIVSSAAAMMGGIVGMAAGLMWPITLGALGVGIVTSVVVPHRQQRQRQLQED